MTVQGRSDRANDFISDSSTKASASQHLSPLALDTLSAAKRGVEARVRLFAPVALSAGLALI